ncbi:unnamed protein product [Closterium sp. NIES-54]
MVNTTTLRGQRVAICTCTRTGRHLATFTRRPWSSLYTLATEPPQVAGSAQVSASGQVATPCSCHLLSHQTLLWHHCLGHPSLPRLRGMHSRLLVSGLPRSLPPLPPSPAPPCLLCVEGRQRAAPHSSSFPLTTAPLQTLHMDVWGPTRASGQGLERYFLLVVDDYTRYTTVFPLRSKGQVFDVLIPWIRAIRLQLRERFSTVLPVLRLHCDRGGEFSSDLLRDFCRREGILQLITLPDSPQQNGIAERRIGLVMEVACTSMIHATAPHFLWPFAVRYAAHQLNLWPRVSLPETSPTLRWTGEVGDASVFRIWGSRAFVRESSADKLSARDIPYVFLGFPPDAPGLQFYHPTSRRVFPSQDVTFDEPVPFYRLFPYRSAPPPPPPLFLAPGPPPVDPLPPQGPAPSGVSKVDPLPGVVPVEVANDSGAARGTASGGAAYGGAEPRGAESEGAGSGSEGAESGGAEPWGAASSGGPTGASPRLSPRPEPLSPQQLGEWLVRRARLRSGAAGAGATGDTGDTGAGAARVTAEAGGIGGTAAAGPGGARTKGTKAARTCCVGGARAGDPTVPGAAGAGGNGAEGSGSGGGGGAGGAGAGGTGAGGAGAGGAGAGGTGVGGARAGGAGAVDPGAGRAGAGGVLVLLSSTSLPPPILCPPPDQSQPSLQPASPLPAPSPYTEQSGGLTERLHCCVCSLPLLVAELLDFVAACHLDYANASVAESQSTNPPSIGGECALGTDVLRIGRRTLSVLQLLYLVSLPCCLPLRETRMHQTSRPHALTQRQLRIFMVKRSLGSPVALKARHVARGFSQRQGVDYFHTFSPTPKMTTLWVLLHVAAQRDYELHSLDSSTTFLQGGLHEEIWLRRPPGFTGSFLAGTHWSLRRPVYGLRQVPREWHDTLRTILAALGFAPATADPSLFLLTDTSLPPFYVLIYVDNLVFATADTEALTLVKSELQERHTCTDLGELRSYLGLQITQDRARCTITLTQSHMVHQVLQRFAFQFSSPQPTPPSTGHSLSAPPSDESVEPSGLYPELVGCLMYLMTCTRPDLAYPLSLLARYVAPSRHRKVHWDATKRVLRYLCSTSGMGLMLGGRGPVVLTCHADTSWVDKSATQRSSQGYTFSLGSDSVSWRSTRSYSVFSSSCEAEIYASAMAAEELHRLTRRQLLENSGLRSGSEVPAPSKTLSPPLRSSPFYLMMQDLHHIM